MVERWQSQERGFRYPLVTGEWPSPKDDTESATLWPIPYIVDWPVDWTSVGEAHIKYLLVVCFQPRWLHPPAGQYPVQTTQVWILPFRGKVRSMALLSILFASFIQRSECRTVIMTFTAKTVRLHLFDDTLRQRWDMFLVIRKSDNHWVDPVI